MYLLGAAVYFSLFVWANAYTTVENSTDALNIGVYFYDSTSCAGEEEGYIGVRDTCDQPVNSDAVIVTNMPSGYKLVVYKNTDCGGTGHTVFKGPGNLPCFYIGDGYQSANVEQV